MRVKDPFDDIHVGKRKAKGRGAVGKAVVMGLLQRHGEVRTLVVDNTKRRTLQPIVREHVECSPCLLRECPIDHRCMTRVTSERMAATALKLVQESREAWTHGAKS